ncbi:MAG: nucleotidyltransferase family protein [Desulfovibrio sp.]|nr:nucleotidyltransferase family protein [Desulfovibrio sp.]
MAISSLAAIIERLYHQYVSEQDQALLDLVFKRAPVQADVDACLQKADIEVLGGNKSLLLSYLLHEHPELRLGSYAEPRVRGLMRYYHFQNTRTLSHFARIGKALNRAGIPFVLFKGGAIKALRPELSRPMGDTDILLPPGTIREAVRLCEGLGYQHIHGKPTHAVGMHTDKEDAVDLHYLLFDEGRDMAALQAGIFERAKAHKAFGVDFLLPCHEDLFFLVLTNFTKNLHDHTTLGGLYYALCDCRYLLDACPSLEFALVRENAHLGDKEMEVRFAADFMNRVIPGIIPEPERNLPYADKVDDFCNLLVFDENFYMPLRHECQAMRVAELRNYPCLHGRKIVKFLFMDKMRRFPGFVRWYLQRQKTKGGKHAF